MRAHASSRLLLAVVPRRAVDTGDDTADNIVDEGEITMHVATVEDRQRLPLEQRLGEDPHRHVRAAPRSIDREEAQAGHRQAEQMGIALAHQLVGLLGRCVQRDGMVDPVLDPERQRLVAAVDRRRARIDEMLDLAMASEFQHVDLSHQIGSDVGLRIDQRIADPRLGAQMDDPVEFVGSGEGFERLLVAEIDLLEAEGVAMTDEVYPVPREWAERALVSADRYAEMYRESVEDPDSFWRREARRIDWIKPFTKVKETSFHEADFGIKWFADGTLNLSANCL